MSTVRSSFEKMDHGVERHEHVGVPRTDELAYEDEEEPTLHFKTWIALISMGVLQYVSLVALVGPPTVVSSVLSNRRIE